MSSIKLKFRPSANASKEGVLYFQIIHNRTIRRVNTPHRILPEEWDVDSGGVIVPDKKSPRHERLSAIAADVKWEMRRFAEVVKLFFGRSCSVDEITAAFVGEKDGKGLFDFMRRQVERLRGLGRARCSETMDCTLRSFMQFRGGVDVRLDGLTKDVVEQYEAWLRAKGVRRNTSSFYMRNLRAAYKTAVDEGFTEDRHPFRNVYTGVDKTVKRAISIEDVRKIKYLDLGKRPALDFARDILMFSFYMRGMSFVDMAYLRKKDLQAGHVVYRRKKTGHLLDIEVPKEAFHIIEKYNSTTQYLLPLISVEDGTERQQYKNRMTGINRSLKKVGEMVGLPIPLSTYVMRHAWATIARDKGIELAVISEALGHENEATTQIYLDSISTAKVDKANRSILDDL